MAELYRLISNWLNANQGVVAVLLVMAGTLLKWGYDKIFHRQKLVVRLIDLPSFCADIPTRLYDNGQQCYRTALSLYISITNRGKVPVDISKVQAEYRADALKWQHAKWWQPFERFETKIDRIRWCYRFGKLHHVPALEAFFIPLNEEKIKTVSFLIQGNHHLNDTHKELYLQENQSEGGVVYFESGEYWGGYRPKNINNKAEIRVVVTDSAGGKHKCRFRVPLVSLDYARKFNPEFGNSLEKQQSIQPN
jgi:hypothetical protein